MNRIHSFFLFVLPILDRIKTVLAIRVRVRRTESFCSFLFRFEIDFLLFFRSEDESFFPALDPHTKPGSDTIVNIFGSSVSRSVGFFIFFSLQVLQHILDLGKQEHREGEKRDPRRHWSSIRPSLVRWCRSALGGDGRSSGRRRVAGDVEVDGGVVQGLRASRRFSASRRSGRD